MRTSVMALRLMDAGGGWSDLFSGLGIPAESLVSYEAFRAYLENQNGSVSAMSALMGYLTGSPEVTEDAVRDAHEDLLSNVDNVCFVNTGTTFFGTALDALEDAANKVNAVPGQMKGMFWLLTDTPLPDPAPQGVAPMWDVLGGLLGPLVTAKDDMRSALSGQTGTFGTIEQAAVIDTMNAAISQFTPGGG